MSISYPLDILASFPGWSIEFELLWRQEQSRQANGRTIVKDFGSPLWRATYQSRSLAPNDLDAWKARLALLENGLQTFKGIPLSRCFPILYPSGSWPTGGSFDGVSATIASINVNNKALAVDMLPAGFAFSVGDYISIAYSSSPTKYGLHQVMEAATADGSGLTPEFEVRPHLWPGMAVNDLVSVKRPMCPMAIVPGSISASAELQTGRGVVSWQAIEAR
jgi:hypothetical protein